MIWLREDAGIVAAGGKAKSDLGTGQQVDLVDRVPRRNVITLCADNKDIASNIWECNRQAIDFVAAFGQCILPGVTARVLPTWKVSSCGSGASSMFRSRSSQKYCNPRRRLAPLSFAVLRMTSGFVQRELVGDSARWAWRPVNSVSSRCFLVAPETQCVASLHQAVCSRNASR